MSPRLGLTVTLGVVMLSLLAALLVLWIILAIFGLLADPDSGPLIVTLMSVGTVLLVTLIVGVSLYLALSVRAINLTRRQSNFIDAVTHELKSPIASLKLYLQTLVRRQPAPAEAADFYESMLEDCERLDTLINQVLLAGRLERRDTEGEAAPIDLPELIVECADMACLRYRVDRACVEIDAQPCELVGRRIDLDMLFRNLIDNAVKYAGAEPRVRIALRRQEDGRIVFTVADNGRGIPPRLRRKAFRRFERLTQELTREKPGAGLGLYIVRTIVRRLRGAVKIRDNPEGGAIFELTLPPNLAPPRRRTNRDEN